VLTSLRTGQTLAFDRVGDPDAPPIVLLHGLSGSRLAYREVVGHLRGDVRNIDLRGHGESSRASLDAYDAASYAADIAALVELEVGGPAVVVGHSLGGVVAAELARSRPDLVTAVFLEDPPLYEGDAERRSSSPTAKFFPEMIAAVRDLQARGAPAEDYMSLVVEPTPEEASARCASLHHWDPTTMEAAVAGIVWRGFDPDATLSCPVTVVRADPTLAVFTPDDADRYAAANPHAHIHEVPGASHTVHASPTLDVYLSHLTAFLASP
jgi:pimeloyl-ACP methyl ester carboxylesterase